MTDKNTALESMTFESALAELEIIVRDLESGKAALADSIAAYERGTALKLFCEEKLREAQTKIESISVKSDGSLTTKPFKEQE
jgi:exodeoxyribonuclease VII small subunit